MAESYGVIRYEDIDDVVEENERKCGVKPEGEQRLYCFWLFFLEVIHVVCRCV